METVPFSPASALVALLQWVMPILACVWAMRTDKSRAHILLVSAGAAMFAGLFMIVPFVQSVVGHSKGIDGVAYMLVNLLLSSAVFGTFIAVAGLVIQRLVNRREYRTGNGSDDV